MYISCTLIRDTFQRPKQRQTEVPFPEKGADASLGPALI
jgi:hypothetical protein